MIGYSKTIIAGNISRTGELREMPSGGKVHDLSVAVNRTYTDKNGKQTHTEFHKVVSFGRLADIMSKLQVGAFLLVDGRYQVRKDREGKLHPEIVADTVQFNSLIDENVRYNVKDDELSIYSEETEVW